jgi:phage baseplate assembly protein W
VAARTYRRLGSDLALTRYTGVPGAVPLDAADSWGSLDLQIAAGGATGRNGDLIDLSVTAGRENLGQALMLRLLTRQGSLAALGHPAYGSRLVDLIGEENNAANRNLARLYTIAAIGQEPRVRELLDLSIEASPDDPNTIRIGFAVLPVDDDDPLALTLEVAL